MEISSSSCRKPYFIEEEEDLSEMEAGYSQQNGVVSSPFSSCSYVRMNSYNRNNTNYYYSSSYSPRSVVSGRFHDFRFDNQQPHFLDSCFLCKKPLGDNRDIFMYRGDTPFCSEECRTEQIERDEVKEKKQNLSYSVKSAMRRKETRSSSTSPTRSRGYAFHNGGTVAAA